MSTPTTNHGNHPEENMVQVPGEQSRKIDWKTKLYRIGTVSCVILICLNIFVTWPNPYTTIGSLFVILFSVFYVERFNDFILLSNKAVVITGCDTGFGHVLAKELAQLGVTTFAGCLHPGGEGARELKDIPRVHVMPMDVTSDKQIKQCVKYVQENLEPGTMFWGVVNNAGHNFLGDIKLTTMKQFELVNNVNYLGAVRVVKAFLPLVRKNKGRFLIVTSVKGLIAQAYNGAYSSTKYALEAFSDILRTEMRPFGVTVSIIEPGNFGGATGCLNMDRMTKEFDDMWNTLPQETKDTYGREYLEAHITTAENAIPSASFKLKAVTDAMVDALFKRTPRVRYCIGGGNGYYDTYKLVSMLYPFLPASIADRWVLDPDVNNFPVRPELLQQQD